MKDEKVQVKPVETAAINSVPKFSKGQLLAAKKFKDRRDALSVVLEDNKMYTNEEAEKLLYDFMKGKVN